LSYDQGVSNEPIQRPQRGHFISFIETRKRELTRYVMSECNFVRERKLGLIHTIGHVVHMTCARNSNGYDITSLNYFSELKAQLGVGGSGVCRSSFCEARAKLKWQAFEYLLNEVNQLPGAQIFWKRRRVFAADGSCLNLPHRDEIIRSFPLEKDARCRAHYPKGLLLSVTDVLSGVPLLAELGHYRTDSERGLLANNLSKIPRGSVVLLDRGFDGVRFFKKLDDHGLFFIARVRTRMHERCDLNIQRFLRSGRKEQVIEMENAKGIKMRVRLLRYGLDDENLPIVLATSLFRKICLRSEVWSCYKKRWNVETLYYRVKRLLQVEMFHSRSINGVRQEIWANLFTLGLTATLVNQAVKVAKMKTEMIQPNFKNAIEVVRRHLCLIVLASCKAKKRTTLHEMYTEILKLKCQKQPGRKNPRIARRPQNTCRE